MSDFITIASSVLPSSAKVVGFRGVEAISRPYEVEIFFMLKGDAADELDLADAIGAKARLVIDRATDDIPPYYFTGILAIVEMLHAVEGYSLFRAVLVPRLHQLGLSRHSRIFTKMSVPDVIEAILQDNGLSGSDYELRLRSYEPEEHITQYRESDLDFISRWMEREGIFYFFEHTEDGDKLILCDHLTYEKDPMGRPVRYHPQLGHDRSAGQSFRSFSARYATLPTAVKLRDYDYAKPNLDVSGSAKVDDNGAGEVSLYGERFFSPAAGKRLAQLRAEELLARKVVFRATGTRLHLHSGYTFELDEHPRAAMNAKYVAIEIRHEGNQAGDQPAFKDLLRLSHEDVYFVEVDAIPAETQFRAESRARWPRIYGFENGTVDGAATSEYAQIDDQGRYSVKFRFDESDLKSGKASTWVRMMQPHGGGIEGFHFPLRKGTEVAIAFLGGDPDRPVITGVVPNALTPSPVTSGNHTKNVIQTGGRNRLELEDLAGQQRITMSTPYANSYVRMGSPNEQHELIVHTDENALVDAHLAYDTVVGVAPAAASGAGNMTVTVLNNHTTTIKNEHMTTLVEKGNQSNTVAVGTLTEEVKGKVKETYHDDQTTVVEGHRRLTVTKQAQYHSTDSFFINSRDQLQLTSANASFLTVEAQGLHENIKGGHIATIEGGHHTTVKTGNWKIDVPAGNANIKCIDGKLETAGKWNELINGDHVKVTINATSETLIGVKNENFVGGKLGITLGYVGEVFVGVKHELSASVNASINLGIRAELRMIEERDLVVNNMKIGLTLAAVATKIRQHGMRLSPAGFTIM
jgi:type VI secretion system secreted protein VgrG